MSNSYDRRILTVTTVDVMAWVLLRSWLLRLLDDGFEVHIACSRSQYFENLRADGFIMHEVALTRSFNPFLHIRPLIQLYLLMTATRFPIVNAHSPVAGAVARIAAYMARCKTIVYTVHGFYFHENMAALQRWLFIAIEWLLGSLTSMFMFVSLEDRYAAVRYGIARDPETAITILNGVDVTRFKPSANPDERNRHRLDLGFANETVVIGIVGRLVKEKGFREFLDMAKILVDARRNVRFLVVGDSLPSDRDQFGLHYRQRVSELGLESHFVFTGLTDRVPFYLQLMDIFVLPTYREGFGRVVVEAMLTKVPVVSTNIRGPREIIEQGQTGLLVPVRDAQALANSVAFLMDHPENTARIIEAAYELAHSHYDENLVKTRFLTVIRRAAERRVLPAQVQPVRRLADVVISGAALLFLAPLLCALAVVIRVVQGTSPVFAQRRVGMNEREFVLYKFCTMTDARDHNGALLADEQRLSPLGRFLRSTSLDELPQLWNVLKGDMSLVGPRPLLPEYLPRYSEVQRRRHEVKPGITGWVQVNGRNSLTWEEKFDLDVWYVDHRSLGLDVRILWMTLLRVLRRNGISQTGHATMPEFMGSPGQAGRNG